MFWIACLKTARRLEELCRYYYREYIQILGHSIFHRNKMNSEGKAKGEEGGAIPSTRKEGFGIRYATA
jgi:hypothetical protein